jgi:hypothetical protein
MMNTTMIPQAPTHHRPDFRTTPTRCTECCAPVENMEAWLATECRAEILIEVAA